MRSIAKAVAEHVLPCLVHAAYVRGLVVCAHLAVKVHLEPGSNKGVEARTLATACLWLDSAVLQPGMRGTHPDRGCAAPGKMPVVEWNQQEVNEQ